MVNVNVWLLYGPGMLFIKQNGCFFTTQIIFANLKFNEFIMRDLNTSVSRYKICPRFLRSITYSSQYISMVWYIVHMQ